MITPSIVAEDLTKGYGSLTALSNLNLKIEGSKCVGFLGPNGAGKTTTLKIQALVESLAKIEPWFLITYGATIITNVLVDPYPTTLSQDEAFAPYASIPEGIAILLTYFVVTALLGLVLFERREFT